MTSGTNLFVRKSDVIYLDISSESALQYMLTAGAVMPQKLVHDDKAPASNISQEAAEKLAGQQKKA